jgi:hypothetical protein
MGYVTNNDNIYQEGTTICAKAHPEMELRIDKYYRRIYYCSVVGQPDHKQFAYFQAELIPPTVK